MKSRICTNPLEVPNAYLCQNGFHSHTNNLSDAAKVLAESVRKISNTLAPSRWYLNNGSASSSPSHSSMIRESVPPGICVSNGFVRTLQYFFCTMSTRLFDHFLLVRVSDGTEKDTCPVPYIRYQYSVSTDSVVPEAVLGFCYPDCQELTRTSQVQGENFTFVLTDAEGMKMYGFCRRHLPASSAAKKVDDYLECVCLLSRWPFFAMFNAILEYIQIRWLLVPGAVFPFLHAILEHPFPLPGEIFTIKIHGSSEERNAEESFTFERNEDAPPPNMDILFKLLTCEDIITLLTCLLLEKRIILTAKKLSTLSACIHSIMALLYPFYWQHIFIPLMPANLLSYACAPMPYCIGVHSEHLQSILALPLDETVLVNLNDGKIGIINSSSKFLRLPTNESSLLLYSIEAIVKNRHKGLGIDTIAICDAFLKCFVSLFGIWRRYVRTAGGKAGPRYKIDVDSWIIDSSEIGEEYAEFMTVFFIFLFNCN